MSKASSYSLLLNARLATAQDADDSWQLAHWSTGALAFSDGRIVASGEQQSLLQAWPQDKAETVYDAGGWLVTPGLVDAHTHPVFFAHRANEFAMRIDGASYVEIAQAGGGIRSSVRSLRQASEEQLLALLLHRLDRFLAHGTTTVEAKSGYGLSVEDELKMLRVIRKANALHAVDLVPTFLGAHEVPDEYSGNRDGYLSLVVNEMLPQVAEEGLAEFMDVFCEQHVFQASEALGILQAGSKAGLKPKLHADQLSDGGGARVAVETGAVSADHLEHTPPEMDEALAEAGVVPVLLPGADYFLASQLYPPAKRMIAAGLPVAVATDFNPGTCMCESLQMMMNLACLQLRMTPAESLIAVTRHAAMALDRDQQCGSLLPGKLADFVIWKAREVAELPYHFGTNLVERVFKRGKPAFTNSDNAQYVFGEA